METLSDLLLIRSGEAPDACTFSFLENGRVVEKMSNAALWTCASGIAEALLQRGLSGERALLLYPAGLDYIRAFYGCVLAGVTAAPVSVDLLAPTHIGQAVQLFREARPALVLSTGVVARQFQAGIAAHPELSAAPWFLTDAETIPTPGAAWTPPSFSGKQPALIKFTSSTTGPAKGCLVTHERLLSHLAAFAKAHGAQPGERSLAWSAHFHVSGTIFAVTGALYSQLECFLMSPKELLRRPLCWLEAMSELKLHYSIAPNAVLALCAQLGRHAVTATPLDLHCCKGLFVGGETVRHETLRAFAETFAPCGFREAAFRPCYGMTETGMISIQTEKAPPPHVFLSRTAMARGVVEIAAPDSGDAYPVVGQGPVVQDIDCAVVSPETRTRAVPGTIGEFWLRGTLLSDGYWENPAASEEAFQAYLADTGEGPFFRTGDLGFVRDGQLYVTGRVKDIIVISGSNHYPQDLEDTASSSHAALRPGCAIAVAVEGAMTEGLVLALEVNAGFLRTLQEGGSETRAARCAEVFEAVSRAVLARHRIQIRDQVLVPPESLPKTSSGKYRRTVWKDRYLHKEIPAIIAQQQTHARTAAAPGARTLLERLENAAPVARKGLLQGFLRKQAARLANVEEDAFSGDTPFADIGLDAGCLEALRALIKTELKLSVNLEDLRENASVVALAAWIAKRFQDSHAAES